MNEAFEPMISVSQLAKILGCSEDYVRAQVRQGNWPHHKLGPKMTRFSVTNVQTIKSDSSWTPPTPTLEQELREAHSKLDFQKQTGASALSIKRQENLVFRLGMQRDFASESNLGPKEI